jgi:hypothetical protein
MTAAERMRRMRARRRPPRPITHISQVVRAPDPPVTKPARPWFDVRALIG